MEDWTTYVERVEQYCLANEIQDERQVAVLLSVMGAKTYNLLCSLVAPAKPADKTFDEITRTLKSNLNQSKSESMSKYIAELRKLAEHCQFRDGLSDALRDRFVCRLHNESIQKRLLTEDKLTLQRAVEIAVSVETAARDATELQGKNPTTCSVFKMHSKLCNTKAKPCFRCGKQSHDPTECWFKDKDCRQCNKRGHIQKMCKSKYSNSKDKLNVKRVQRLHKVAQTDSDSSCEEELACLGLYATEKDDSDVIWLTPKVNGVPLKMELDTGSALSIISSKDYKAKFPDAKLSRTTVKLKTYTDEKVTPLGKLKVKVKYKNQNLQS